MSKLYKRGTESLEISRELLGVVTVGLIESSAMFKEQRSDTGVAAEFEDETLRVGVTRMKDRSLVSVFNWNERPEKFPVKLPRAGEVTDLWSGHNYGRRQGVLEVELKAHERTVLVVR